MSKIVAYLDAAGLWVAAHPKTSFAIFTVALVLVSLV